MINVRKTGSSNRGDETWMVYGKEKIDDVEVKFKGEIFMPSSGSNVRPFVRDGQIPDTFMNSSIKVIKAEQIKKLQSKDVDNAD